LDLIKQMEHQGYDLEAADGTFELLVRTAVDPDPHWFDVDRYEVSVAADGLEPLQTNATVTLRVHGQQHSATASGHGALHALHTCLRTCLARAYPQIKEVRLIDYKVRLLDGRKGSASKVRVLIEWSDHLQKWSTVGVSDNVVEASWMALLDALRLELMRVSQQGGSIQSSRAGAAT
jgi:2-isopropylmalate synthase